MILTKTKEFWQIYSEYEENFELISFEDYTEEVSEKVDSLIDDMQEEVHYLEFLLHAGPNSGFRLLPDTITEALQVIRKFGNIYDKHRELKARYQQSEIIKDVTKLDTTLEKAENSLNEVKEIKNSLHGFFGIIVGILSFVFTNVNLLQLANHMTLDKIIVVIGLVNLFLGLGLVILMSLLSEMLGLNNKNINWTKYCVIWLLATISVIILGFLSKGIPMIIVI